MQIVKKLLVTRESACLQPIMKLVEKQNHRTLVLWAIDCAGRVLAIFEKKNTNDKRPRNALDAARLWSRGEIKMPAAKKAAHGAHNAATEVGDPAAEAAARAMGHVVGTVHVETHALGVVMYGVTAFVYDDLKKNSDEIIARECNWFYNRLLYWENKERKIKQPWTHFLLRNDLNKEKLLRQKKELKKKLSLLFQ